MKEYWNDNKQLICIIDQYFAKDIIGIIIGELPIFKLLQKQIHDLLF